MYVLPAYNLLLLEFEQTDFSLVNFGVASVTKRNDILQCCSPSELVVDNVMPFDFFP